MGGGGGDGVTSVYGVVTGAGGRFRSPGEEYRRARGRGRESDRVVR